MSIVSESIRHTLHHNHNHRTEEYYGQEGGDSVGDEEEEEEELEEEGRGEEEGAYPSGSVSNHLPFPRRGSKSSSLTSLEFPLSRVKRLIKSEGEIQFVSTEAAFLIAKASELFLEKFVEDAFDKMADNNRMFLSYGDLSSHVMSTERLEFLADFVPEKVVASVALSTKVEADD